MQDETFFQIFATGIVVAIAFSLLLIYYRYYSKEAKEHFNLKESLYLLILANGIISYLVFMVVLTIEVVRYIKLYI